MFKFSQASILEFLSIVQHFGFSVSDRAKKSFKTASCCCGLIRPPDAWMLAGHCCSSLRPPRGHRWHGNLWPVLPGQRLGARATQALSSSWSLRPSPSPWLFWHPEPKPSWQENTQSNTHRHSAGRGHCHLTFTWPSFFFFLHHIQNSVLFHHVSNAFCML